jgi:hypothetical protein
MTDCEDNYRTRIQANVEGEFTTWAEKSFSPVSGDFLTECWGYFDEAGQKFWEHGGGPHGSDEAVIDLVTGNITYIAGHPDWYPNAASIFGKYILQIGSGTIDIYKEGIILYSITISYSILSFGGPYISPSGKWIVVLDTENKLHFYEGS